MFNNDGHDDDDDDDHDDDDDQTSGVLWSVPNDGDDDRDYHDDDDDDLWLVRPGRLPPDWELVKRSDQTVDWMANCWQSLGKPDGCNSFLCFEISIRLFFFVYLFDLNVWIEKQKHTCFYTDFKLHFFNEILRNIWVIKAIKPLFINLF